MARPPDSTNREEIAVKRFFAVLTITLAASFVAAGPAPQSAGGSSNDPKASPAYAVLVLRKAAVEADLADLSSKFTDGSRDIRAKRLELNSLIREMETMQKVGRNNVPRLSNAYGNLILSKVSLEVELEDLLGRLTPEHPGVKKKRVELDALTREIEKLLR
jgi:uncharacterized protein involved in exopolysaccharide biosynthesis